MNENRATLIKVLFIILIYSCVAYSYNDYSIYRLAQSGITQKDTSAFCYEDSTISYIVKPGDCLWKIAYKNMGDSDWWPEIYDLNKNKIKDPNLIVPGQKLVVLKLIKHYYQTADTHQKVDTVQKADTLQNLVNNKENINGTTGEQIKTQHRSLGKDIGIGGLVIDRTQSKWGRDFVDLFNKNFNPPSFLNDYTIVIEEKPLPRFGTVIMIKVNGDYIFRKFIQPRYQIIKQNAEQGTQMALSYLANYQQIQKDLQGDDLKGTGIY